MPSRTMAAAPILALVTALALAVAACQSAGPPPGPPGTPGTPGESPRPSRPVVVPAPGHEVYGYVPSWELESDGIAAHVARVPLTTVALFSVTHRGGGRLNTGARGYRAVTGDTGREVARDARARGARVELVYTSFGTDRNRRLLERPAMQATLIAELVALAGSLELDGVNVDIEAVDPDLVPAYGRFVADLREAVVAADPGDQVSTATGAGAVGAAMAVAATAAGADRVFLMAYDYRTGGSQPGATSPLDRIDGAGPSVRSSVDAYLALGVPPERLLLGLPLYGVAWPVAGPVVGAPSTGRGEAWFPRRNVGLLLDPDARPERDPVEQVDVYLVGSDGSSGAPPAPLPPTPGLPVPTADLRTWRAVYVDSPATLAPKLALANERGLAGAGFWAIGYERGLPGYVDLVTRFASGETLP